MILQYYKSTPPNFGDDLNQYLFPKLFGSDFEQKAHDTSFYGIGTIIDNRIPLDQNSVIFGTGIRDISRSYANNNWDIRFVRGPISANILNAKHISDPAYCINFLEHPTESEKKHKISLIPYFRHFHLYNWKLLTRLYHINIIDPSDNIEHIISEIRSSEKIIAGAMHGAIIADAFRVPWVRLKLGISGKETPFQSELKWHDWKLSMNLKDISIDISMDHRFDTRTYKGQLTKLQNTFLLLKNIRKAELNSLFQISSDKLYSARTDQFKEEIVSFTEKYNINTGIIK